jgi:hypothetical protein
MLDRIDRRALGAIRLVDGVTGATLTGAYAVTAEGLELRRNRLGLHVIFRAEGLAAHAAAFDAPPAAPAAESLPFTVTVTDPARVFLPAAQEIRLPRRFDLADGVRDLLEPIDIVLASGPARALPLGWAAMAVHLRDTILRPIRGGLVEVVPQTGGARLGWGITNERGDVLIPVPGLPLLRAVPGDPGDPDDDTVASAETPASLRAVVDPALPWPADPVRLDAERATLRQATLPGPFGLRAGITLTATITVDLT